MADEISISFHCKECGGTILELPDDYTDDSIAKCKACGQEFGTWGEVQAKAMEAAADEMRRKLASSFKGLKGWKIK